MASVEERVIDIVAEQLGADKEKINTDTHFVNDLGADSLDTVELVMELEEEFDEDEEEVVVEPEQGGLDVALGGVDNPEFLDETESDDSEEDS